MSTDKYINLPPVVKSMDYESHLNKGHLLCRAILEIVGAPAEHIEKTLKDYVEGLKKNHDITDEKFAETKPHEKLFSTFVELEIWVEGVPGLFDFCIESMPSSIEVIEPASMNMKAADLSASANELMQKLHSVDLAVKDSKARIKLLEKNASTLVTNLIGLALKQGPLDLEGLKKDTGIEEKKLQEFLDHMVKKNQIGKEGESYRLR